MTGSNSCERILFCFLFLSCFAFRPVEKVNTLMAIM